MVTLAIVSFGLLGIAGIIANSLKSHHTSHGRTQASMLAYDIIERMRANRVTAEATPSPYDLPITATAPVEDTVAANDLRQWRQALAATLPEGRGSITLHDQTKKVTVVIQWRQRKLERGTSADTDDAQQLTMETRL